jgi:hypothetical protein
VLDSTPGKLFAAGGGEDHPGELIASLRQMPEVVPSRRALIESLSSQGFSASVAQVQVLLTLLQFDYLN